jgi:hypothetical protein
MAYDRRLADRIRAALAGRAVREVGMFGGLTFMVNDKIAVTADTQGDLMVRCDPARAQELLERDGARWPVMKGRKMSRGWIVVAADRLDADETLTSWIREALDHSDRQARRG